MIVLLKTAYLLVFLVILDISSLSPSAKSTSNGLTSSEKSTRSQSGARSAFLADDTSVGTTKNVFSKYDMYHAALNRGSKKQPANPSRKKSNSKPGENYREAPQSAEDSSKTHSQNNLGQMPVEHPTIRSPIQPHCQTQSRPTLQATLSPSRSHDHILSSHGISLQFNPPTYHFNASVCVPIVAEIFVVIDFGFDVEDGDAKRLEKATPKKMRNVGDIENEDNSLDMSESIELISVTTSNPQFHPVMFHPQTIRRDETIAINLLFLPYFVEKVEGFITITAAISDADDLSQTKTLISYNYSVTGEASPNPYRLHPFVGHRIVSKSISNSLVSNAVGTAGTVSGFEQSLIVYNPYKELLHVKEVFTTEDFLVLKSVRFDDDFAVNDRLAYRSQSWTIEPGTEKEIIILTISPVALAFPSTYHGYVHVKTDRDNMVLPVDIHVIEGGFRVVPEVINFGTLTSFSEQQIVDLKIYNIGPAPLKVLEIVSMNLDSHISIDVIDDQRTSDTTVIRALDIDPQLISSSKQFRSIGSNANLSAYHYLMCRCTFTAGTLTGNFSGQILVITNHSNPALAIQHVSYEATILHGGIGFNNEEALFFLPIKNLSDAVEMNLQFELPPQRYKVPTNLIATVGRPAKKKSNQRSSEARSKKKHSSNESFDLMKSSPSTLIEVDRVFTFTNYFSVPVLLQMISVVTCGDLLQVRDAQPNQVAPSLGLWPPVLVEFRQALIREVALKDQNLLPFTCWLELWTNVSSHRIPLHILDGSIKIAYLDAGKSFAAPQSRTTSKERKAIKSADRGLSLPPSSSPINFDIHHVDMGTISLAEPRPLLIAFANSNPYNANFDLSALSPTVACCMCLESSWVMDNSFKDSESDAIARAHILRSVVPIPSSYPELFRSPKCRCLDPKSIGEKMTSLELKSDHYSLFSFTFQNLSLSHGNQQSSGTVSFNVSTARQIIQFHVHFRDAGVKCSSRIVPNTLRLSNLSEDFKSVFNSKLATANLISRGDGWHVRFMLGECSFLMFETIVPSELSVIDLRVASSLFQFNVTHTDLISRPITNSSRNISDRSIFTAISPVGLCSISQRIHSVSSVKPSVNISGSDVSNRNIQTDLGFNVDFRPVFGKTIFLQMLLLLENLKADYFTSSSSECVICLEPDYYSKRMYIQRLLKNLDELLNLIPIDKANNSKSVPGRIRKVATFSFGHAATLSMDDLNSSFALFESDTTNRSHIRIYEHFFLLKSLWREMFPSGLQLSPPVVHLRSESTLHSLSSETIARINIDFPVAMLPDLSTVILPTVPVGDIAWFFVEIINPFDTAVEFSMSDHHLLTSTIAPHSVWNFYNQNVTENRTIEVSYVNLNRTKSDELLELTYCDTPNIDHDHPFPEFGCDGVSHRLQIVRAVKLFNQHLDKSLIEFIRNLSDSSFIVSPFTDIKRNSWIVSPKTFTTIGPIFFIPKKDSSPETQMTSLFIMNNFTGIDRIDVTVVTGAPKLYLTEISPSRVLPSRQSHQNTSTHLADANNKIAYRFNRDDIPIITGETGSSIVLYLQNLGNIDVTIKTIVLNDHSCEEIPLSALMRSPWSLFSHSISLDKDICSQFPLTISRMNTSQILIPLEMSCAILAEEKVVLFFLEKSSKDSLLPNYKSINRDFVKKLQLSKEITDCKNNDTELMNSQLIAVEFTFISQLSQLAVGRCIRRPPGEIFLASPILSLLFKFFLSMTICAISCRYVALLILKGCQVNQQRMICSGKFSQRIIRPLKTEISAIKLSPEGTSVDIFSSSPALVDSSDCKFSPIEETHGIPTALGTLSCLGGNAAGTKRIDSTLVSSSGKGLSFKYLRTGIDLGDVISSDDYTFQRGIDSPDFRMSAVEYLLSRRFGDVVSSQTHDTYNETLKLLPLVPSSDVFKVDGPSSNMLLSPPEKSRVTFAIDAQPMDALASSDEVETMTQLQIDRSIGQPLPNFETRDDHLSSTTLEPLLASTKAIRNKNKNDSSKAYDKEKEKQKEKEKGKSKGKIKNVEKINSMESHAKLKPQREVPSSLYSQLDRPKDFLPNSRDLLDVSFGNLYESIDSGQHATRIKLPQPPFRATSINEYGSEILLTEIYPLSSAVPSSEEDRSYASSFSLRSPGRMGRGNVITAESVPVSYPEFGNNFSHNHNYNNYDYDLLGVSNGAIANFSGSSSLDDHDDFNEFPLRQINDITSDDPDEDDLSTRKLIASLLKPTSCKHSEVSVLSDSNSSWLSEYLSQLNSINFEYGTPSSNTFVDAESSAEINVVDRGDNFRGFSVVESSTQKNYEESARDPILVSESTYSVVPHLRANTASWLDSLSYDRANHSNSNRDPNAVTLNGSRGLDPLSSSALDQFHSLIEPLQRGPSHPAPPPGLTKRTTISGYPKYEDNSRKPPLSLSLPLNSDSTKNQIDAKSLSPGGIGSFGAVEDWLMGVIEDMEPDPIDAVLNEANVNHA